MAMNRASPIVTLNGERIPFSSLASHEAREVFCRRADLAGPNLFDDPLGARRFYDSFNDSRLAEMERCFATDVERTTLSGVTVDIVSPRAGIAEADRQRVLINLHGGGFIWGSGSGALVEAIPIAATANLKVVTVDYRMAPEFQFPAASEDVAAVYDALLADYSPADIGIYGSSAGGMLTAQAVAWFADRRLPLPGAIATLSATGTELEGDSAHLGLLLTDRPRARDDEATVLLRRLPYLASADPNDPLAFPDRSPSLLAAFPPTLLLAGSRDYAASAITSMHRRLKAADVDAELYLFDGLWHAFFIYPDLPESRETYEIVSRFFASRLGREASR